MEISFREPTIDDLDEITSVMTRAFDDDAQKFLGEESGGPPGYNNGDFYRKWLFNDKTSSGLLMLVDNRVIGASIFWVNRNRHHNLGNIFIDPEFQNRNLGTRFWEEIKKRAGSYKSWTLETPAYAIKNHHFYEKKCGFSRIKENRKFFTYRK